MDTATTPKVFLVAKLKADFGYEVVAFNKVKQRALLWGNEGFLSDISFDIELIKRCYTRTSERPAFLRERPTDAATESIARKLSP